MKASDTERTEPCEAVVARACNRKEWEGKGGVGVGREGRDWGGSGKGREGLEWGDRPVREVLSIFPFVAI